MQFRSELLDCKYSRGNYLYQVNLLISGYLSAVMKLLYLFLVMYTNSGKDSAILFAIDTRGIINLSCCTSAIASIYAKRIRCGGEHSLN